MVIAQFNETIQCCVVKIMCQKMKVVGTCIVCIRQLHHLFW